jgi:hypothetical protein
MSPRLMGGTAYRLGQMGRTICPGCISTRPRRYDCAGRITEMWATILARLGMVSTPNVETTASLADELYGELERLTAEQGRPIEADEIISSWCPRCNARRRAKAEAMRRWRAKRHAVPGAS